MGPERQCAYCGEPLVRRANEAKSEFERRSTCNLRCSNKRRSPGPDWVVENAGYSTPCWVWQKAKNSMGYGSKYCYELMAYAHARGATVRQLSEITGWSSSSTIHNALLRTRKRLPVDSGVLTDECPADLR